MKTAYSSYNSLKYNVLLILSDGKWHTPEDIYNRLKRSPKPKRESFKREMRRYHSYGYYKTRLVRKNGKLKEEKRYIKRRYVLKRKEGKKVYYKISSSGRRIFYNMSHSLSLKQVRHWRL
ncbi:MAG: hypothetical protein AYK18_07060 [Theionarchaea archaeon DG-70]|nr:MAG: hypothetical protein AYK18_07060 [Theionarchaea archaeon DG-70]